MEKAVGECGRKGGSRLTPQLRAEKGSSRQPLTEEGEPQSLELGGQCGGTLRARPHAAVSTATACHWPCMGREKGGHCRSRTPGPLPTAPKHRPHHQLAAVVPRGWLSGLVLPGWFPVAVSACGAPQLWH